MLLGLEGLTTAFPGVVAKDDLSIGRREGEIHAPLGEDGAGKSALVKMDCGLVRADFGALTLRGV